MSTQQAILEQILSGSVKKIKTKLQPAQLKAFQQKQNALPKNFKEIDVTPYLFIFSKLMQFPDCYDFVFTQYLRLATENILSLTNEKIYPLITQHFWKGLPQHAFKVTQNLLLVEEPILDYFKIFFSIYSTIPMPENVITNFKEAGFLWLSRAFCFRSYPLPDHILAISNKLYSQQLKVPTLQETDMQLYSYIDKILHNVLFKVSQNIQGKHPKSGKFGFCFMCSNTAQYYCKDTKIPVCGTACKKQHLRQLAKNCILGKTYDNNFRKKIEKFFMDCVQSRSSLSLGVDYLCFTYMFSSYMPQHVLPIRSLLSSPLTYQRIWLLLACYYHKKGQAFEHILAFATKSKQDFIKNAAIEYFQKLIQTDRFFKIYQIYDQLGPYRLIPTVIDSFEQDDQKAYEISASIIQKVFQNLKSQQLVQNVEDNYIKLFNQQASVFVQWYRQKHESQTEPQICRFIIRNEASLDRQGLCTIMEKDDKLCKEFLRQIVNPISHAPLDEILRQIFYYLNIRVSDKIYHLLELLCQVCQIQPIVPGFDKDRLFQLCYFLLMIQTQLHNPSAGNKKPTLQDTLKRIKDFDMELYQNKKTYFEDMFYRISSEPFSQTNKCLSDYYKPVPQQLIQNDLFNPGNILYDNWQLILLRIKERNNLGLLYRCAKILQSKPLVAQHFFKLILQSQKKSSNIQQGSQIFQAVLSLLQTQPNMTPSWQQILILKEKYEPVVSIKLADFINWSSKLTDTNFLSFVKTILSNYPLATNVQNYINLLHFNNHRINMFQQSFLKMFTMEKNGYVQLFIVEACSFLGEIYIDRLNLDHVTQGLFLDTACCLANQSLSDRKWKSLFKKVCEYLMNFESKMVFFSVCSQAKCPYLKDYIIQQTINSGNPKFLQIQQGLSEQIDQFAQHLGSFSPLVLAFLLTQNNFPKIIQYLQFFINLRQLFPYLQKNIQKIQENQQSSQKIFKLLKQEKQTTQILSFAQFAVFLVEAVVRLNKGEQLLTQIVNFHIDNVKAIEQLTLKQLGNSGNILIEILKTISLLAQQIRSKQQLEYFLKRIQAIEEISVEFNENHQQRFAFMKRYNLNKYPNLFKQEKEANAIEIQFRIKIIQNFEHDHPFLQDTLAKLLVVFLRIQKDYLYVIQHKQQLQDKHYNITIQKKRKIIMMVSEHLKWIQMAKILLLRKEKDVNIYKLKKQLLGRIIKLAHGGALYWGQQPKQIPKASGTVQTFIQEILQSL